MIESMSIGSVATFGSEPEVMENLSKFNYLFGPNGSGKTTISRVIAEQEGYPSCNVRWRAGRELETMVYNLDFVERNFTQSTELKGVFTLGEQQIETLGKIARVRDDIERLEAQGENLKETLSGPNDTGGKRAERQRVEDELKKQCWDQKKKHDANFSEAFRGVRSSGDKFKAKILSHRAKNSTSPPELDDLVMRAGTVFGSSPNHESLVPALDGSDLLGYEKEPVLQQRVVGKTDVQVADLIQRLSNSDWVRRGQEYLESSGGACPFCQQPLPASFSDELESYFDESYRHMVARIERLEGGYAEAAEKLQSAVASLIEQERRFLDTDEVIGARDLLEVRIRLNRERLAAKREAPSESVTPESISDLLAQLQGSIEAANEQVEAHNRMVSNLNNERAALCDQIWEYLVSVELADALVEYDKRTADVIKAIEALEHRVEDVENQLRSKRGELHSLERNTTSIEPTIADINNLLRSVGFTSFSIQQAEPRNSYKLVREDGTDAKETLSEGERSFVTFLYYYHLVRGSIVESGVNTDRIVVFDDPVSSLDSDVLFIVSSLIKSLCEEVRGGHASVKQVFVLTHNVYFHREVTFNSKRPRNRALNEETFWIVRKVGARSAITNYSSNPIRTSYDLLWEEVRNPTPSSVTIQNTLRRILENYFTILGRVDPESIVEHFEGRDRAICHSLFSWVNAGSHYAFDDLYVAATDGAASYLRVFRQVFELSGQEGHYRMMMQDAYEESAGES